MTAAGPHAAERAAGRRTRAVLVSDLRGWPLAIGRSILALGSLATLLTTPADALLIETNATPSGLSCAGLRGASVWCIADGVTGSVLLAQAVGGVVLVAVVIGYRPRWTCVPHWYVSFSFATSVPAANGGDEIAQLVTMLVIPLCLGDRRVWQWLPVAIAPPPIWLGTGAAAHLLLRVQLAVVYIGTVLTKLADERWRAGDALWVIAHDPTYGVPLSERLAYSQLVVDLPWAVAAATWGVVVAQAALAVLLLIGHRGRAWVSALGVPLHLGIAVVLDLPTFGAMMIGALLICCATGKTGCDPAREERRPLHGRQVHNSRVRPRIGE